MRTTCSLLQGLHEAILVFHKDKAIANELYSPHGNGSQLFQMSFHFLFWHFEHSITFHCILHGCPLIIIIPGNFGDFGLVCPSGNSGLVNVCGDYLLDDVATAGPSSRPFLEALCLPIGLRPRPCLQHPCAFASSLAKRNY